MSDTISCQNFTGRSQAVPLGDFSQEPPEAMTDPVQPSDGAAKGRPYRGEDQAMRISRRRASLLEAGLEVFGTQGYRATSVKALCGQVGLTERYFYESFANREALLAAVFDMLAADLDATLRTELARRANDPPARIRAVVTTFFDFMREDPRRARVMLLEILGVNPDIDRRYQAAVRDLARLMEHPSLSLLPPGRGNAAAGVRVMSIGLVGAMVQIATQWMLDGFETPRRTVVQNALRLFEAVADAR